MTQNRSNAVMATRIEPAKSLDDFPTPPWATRALTEKLAGHGFDLCDEHVLEPCANRGFMARPLSETGCKLTAYDIHDYGAGYPVADFLAESRPFDWVITNPPFNRAAQFWSNAWFRCHAHVALLCRLQFVESIGRYASIFKENPPTFIWQFTERVPMHKGKCSPLATTATAYAWFVWINNTSWKRMWSAFDWIPPCRKRLENIDIDYEIPLRSA